jgi:hypothetical protein
MKKTSCDRFHILISMLKRHQRACESNHDQGIDHNLSNVRYFPEHIELDLKDNTCLELTETTIRLEQVEVLLDEVLGVCWITSCDDSLEKARLKKDKFDSIYIQTNQGFLAIEGMGQAVFPIMQFINWVIASKPTSTKHFP